MTVALGYELSDRIAAIGVVVGTLTDGVALGSGEFAPMINFRVRRGEYPPKPLTIVMMSGTKEFERVDCTGELMTTARALADYFACNKEPVVTDFAQDQLDLDNLPFWTSREDAMAIAKAYPTSAKRYVWSDGVDGIEIIAYAVTGMGHLWPGGTQSTVLGTFGPTTCVIDGTELLWEHLSQHSLKDAPAAAGETSESSGGCSIAAGAQTTNLPLGGLIVLLGLRRRKGSGWSRKSFWAMLLSLGLICACSAEAPAAPGRMSKPTAAGSGPANPTPSSSPTGDSSESSTLIAPPSEAPVLRDAGLLSDGCEVGKFCKPQVPDPDNCGTLTLAQDVQVKRTPGNLLLVFDQSLSMSDPWGSTGQTKLMAAQIAIKNAIANLADSLTVGALFFPTAACVVRVEGLPSAEDFGVPGMSTPAVEQIDGPGQIPFRPALQFIDAWDEHWSAMGDAALGLGTPMQEAFDRADTAIAAAQLTGELAVVSVTDGDPNCFPSPMQTEWTTDLQVNRAKSWLAKGTKTYVVGLPGAAGVQVLSDVAQQGGTMEYILPDDPQMLEERLRELVRETMKTTLESCSIQLTPAADPADELLMVVVESGAAAKRQVPHQLSSMAGWTISADGVQVELMGGLCDDAKAGRFTSITFEYPCKSSTPLEPLPPS